MKRYYRHQTTKVHPVIKLLCVTAAFLLVLGLAVDPQDIAPSAATGNGRAFTFIQSVFEQASPSVAYINCASISQDEEGRERLTLGSGSGVIVSPRGYIITNHHVVANAIEVEVVLADGRQTQAAVIAEAPYDDLALLKIELDGLTAAALGDSDEVKVGQVVFPIGNPGGAQFSRSMTMGLISGVDREVELSEGRLAHLLQTDAAINPGNSGGPLVDCMGQVIGINSIKIVDPEFESMGFAIPINTAVNVLRGFCPEAFSSGEKSPQMQE